MHRDSSLAALVVASLAGSCFVSEGECPSNGITLTPCQLSSRAGQTVVVEATIAGGSAPASVNWILPSTVGEAFTVFAEPSRLTLIGRQNVSAVFPVQANLAEDGTRSAGASLQVRATNFGSAPPPFVLFGGDFPVGSEATATAAGGNLYYVAYADSSGGLSSLGTAQGPPTNFFIRQLDIRTNQLLASVGDQFLQFTGSGQGVIEPNVAADCDGNGYWVDYDPARGYVLRRLAPGAAVPDERLLGEFLDFRLGTLSVACDGAIYFVAEASAGPTSEADGPVWTVVPSSLPNRGYIGGVFQSYDGVQRGGIARLLADGSLDFAFNPFGGVPSGSTVFALASIPDSNGTVLVGGDFSSFGFDLRNAFARVSASGVVDALDLGLPQGSTVQAIAVQDNPSIADYKSAYVGGKDLQAGFLRKLESDGTISTTFNPTFDNAVHSIVVQSDGKLLVAGSFTVVNGQTRNRIARLDANGSLDQSFFPSNGGVDLEVHDVAVDFSGRVYVGGEFNFIGQTPANRLLRLLSDGSLDASYDIGTGPGFASQQAPFVYALALQPDGKLLVGGGFDRWNGAPRGNIVRLLESGQVDASFGASTDDAVLAIALQDGQGKIVVGGQFLQVNGLGHDRLARLNPDGSVDQGSGRVVPGLQLYRLDSFDDQPRVIEPGDESTLGFLSSVQSMAVDKQGRVVLGDPSGAYGVARLVVSLELDQATLDESFQPVNLGSVFDVAVDSGDAIYAANSSTITEAGLAFQSIVGLNGLGAEFYRQQGYELACAGDCASADCGTFVSFTRITSLGVAANGALRVVDDIVEDPLLPPECQASVRIVVLDPD